MQHIKGLALDYKDIEEDGELYCDIDLELGDVVNAEYMRCGHDGNPDICALPVPLRDEDTLYRGTRIPAIITDEMIRYKNGGDPFSGGEKTSYLLDRALAVRRVYIPLTFHSILADYVYELLINAYESRAISITARPRKYVVNDQKISQNIVSNVRHFAATGCTESVFGLSGSGKTTAITEVLARYPKVICHEFCKEIGYSYLQIPVLMVTCNSGSGIRGVCLQCAMQIDSFLDCGDEHVKEIGRKSSIPNMIQILIRWIQLFHIGLLVIDECQFLTADLNSAKGIENIATIMAQTGISVLAIGNRESVEKWDLSLRLFRRIVGLPNDSGAVCHSEDYMKFIIRYLYRYTLLPYVTPITEELQDALYTASGGSIDMISLFLVELQRKRILDSGTQINAETVKKMAENEFAQMKMLVQRDTVASNKNFQTLKDEYLRRFEVHANVTLEDEKKETQSRIIAECDLGYDHAVALKETIYAIQDVMGNWSSKQIEMAFSKAEKEPGFKLLRSRERKRRVLYILEHPRERNRTGNNKTKKKTAENVEQLAVSLRESFSGGVHRDSEL